MKVERPRLALMTQFLPDRTSVVLLQTCLCRCRDHHKDRNSVSSPAVIIFSVSLFLSYDCSGRGTLRGLGPLCDLLAIFLYIHF